MIIPAHIPFFAPLLYPNRIWKMPASDKALYISFDDGPHPEVTVKVLDILNDVGAKATFFCLGKNVTSYPAVYQRILDEGHGVGNHSQDHIDGWRTSNTAYVDNVMQASKLIETNLFRPPYGRLRGPQARNLSKQGMKTVMWTVLSGDYNSSLSKEECADRVRKHMHPGNIFLFHDSLKAEKNMLFALELLLKRGTEEGYVFKTIK